MPDCAERFNGAVSSEHGGFWYRSNEVLAEDSRKRRVKICKKCMHRPFRELIETLLNRSLSETEIKEMEETNLILNLKAELVDQI